MTTAFVSGIGPLELAIILLILLLLFGARRLPELGRQLGGGMREFKDSVTRKADEEDSSDDLAQLSAAPGRSEVDGTTPVDGEVVRERR